MEIVGVDLNWSLTAISLYNIFSLTQRTLNRAHYLSLSLFLLQVLSQDRPFITYPLRIMGCGSDSFFHMFYIYLPCLTLIQFIFQRAYFIPPHHFYSLSPHSHFYHLLLKLWLKLTSLSAIVQPPSTLQFSCSLLLVEFLRKYHHPNCWVFLKLNPKLEVTFKNKICKVF